MIERAFLLGAGASRECQSRRASFRSPLSRYFFALLERVHGEDPTAIRVANIQIYVMETRGRVQRGDTCVHYQQLASMMRSHDAIITSIGTRNWIARFTRRIAGSSMMVIPYFKLHGSLNWLLNWRRMTKTATSQ